jgi:FkbM family methyltransferase
VFAFRFANKLIAQHTAYGLASTSHASGGNGSTQFNEISSQLRRLREGQAALQRLVAAHTHEEASGGGGGGAAATPASSPSSSYKPPSSKTKKPTKTLSEKSPILEGATGVKPDMEKYGERYSAAEIAARAPFEIEWDKHLSRKSKVLGFEGSSQTHEDEIVFHTFWNPTDETNGKKSGSNMKTYGRYLEFGALDGRKLSNTRYYDRFLHWSGVLIEPVAKNFKKLSKWRCGTEKDDNPNPAANICVNKAVCEKEGIVEFIGTAATAGMLDTMSEEHKAHHFWDKQRKHVYEVQCSRLDVILKDVGVTHLDFWSLDVEGAELVAMQTMDWTIPVQVVVVELDGKNKEKDEACRDVFRSKGFKLKGYIRQNDLWFDPHYEKKLKALGITPSFREHGNAAYEDQAWMKEAA